MKNRRQVRLCPTFRVHFQTTAGPEIGPLISSHDKQDPWDPEVQIAPQKTSKLVVQSSLDYCVLARNVPRRIWIWICRFATWQHGILSHSDTAFPRLQAKGENDGQRIDDLEGPPRSSPQLCIIPGCRIVAHRHWAPHPSARMVRIESELGKGRAGWAAQVGRENRFASRARGHWRGGLQK